MSKSKEEHMEKRRKHGQTYRELADEFGISKSTAHRKLKNNSDSRPDLLKKGIEMEPGE